MDYFLGSLLLVPYNFAPAGFAVANGAMLSIAQNAALFALIGTTFGGDGKATFALPTVKAPAEGLHWVIATQGIFPSRP